jgi:hypothetical protein
LGKTWEEIYEIKFLKRVRADMYVFAMCIHVDHEEIFFMPFQGLRDKAEVDLRVSWRLAALEGDYVGPFEVGGRAMYCEEAGA